MSKINNSIASALSVPPVHIAKRDNIVWWKAWTIRVISVIAALIVCGVITVALTKLNPVKVYLTMIDGAVGTTRLVWNLFQ
ncbi:MAG: hypothetical protein IIW22_04460, partial [Erysipelotrichaceae bacterium]|nr:hypothetical protein [Erysipelotrichaceae bacterium]